MTIRGIETEPNALRTPLEVHVDASSPASAQAVYERLADLRAHLDWGGDKRPAKMRLLTMDAPPGLATTGTEFVTTGSDPNGTFSDHSVVTEATPGRVFEFVTEAALTPKRGGAAVEWTIIHRYEIAAAGANGSRVSYRFRITRISHLIGPLRLLRTPLAGVLRKAWASFRTSRASGSRRGHRRRIASLIQEPIVPNHPDKGETTCRTHPRRLPRTTSWSRAMKVTSRTSTGATRWASRSTPLTPI